MGTLNVLGLLENIEERDSSALRGLLTCSCGNDHFRLYYQGKRTRGIFSHDIVKSKGNLKIEAVCTSFVKKIEIYDALARKEIRGKDPDSILYVPFDEVSHKIRLSYNYLPEHYKTDFFETIFIEINSRVEDKWHTIVED
ncbi:MAG TPA: hypothetical protein DEG42_01635 [Acholeplasmataceae bacterium]|nr:MAG: hypothetical protein A2013_05780 [Tenericutes bacterium GWE2_38_8]HBG33121.1 hypothetical protein [Acholeplasmataceae bacterium]HBY65085.1 hypothetical protein [Acholeplasmataceae bacterium]